MGATVFDGTGTVPLADATIIVWGDRIERFGPSDDVPVPRGAQVVDLAGRWVIPGLIDAHVHVGRAELPAYLGHGVTSVRDLGGIQDSVIFLRTDVDAGTVDGPRMYISGAPVDGAPPSWPYARVVRTPTDARRAVANAVLISASQLAIGPKVDRRLLTPMLDEATALEAPVAAHLGRVDAVTAARAGITSIERLTGVVEASVHNPAPLIQAHDDYYAGWRMVGRTWSALDSAALDRTARSLVEARVTLVPTLLLHETYAHLTDSAYLAARGGTTEDASQVLRSAGISAAEVQAFRNGRAAQDLFVRRFRANGGRVAAGSDSPGPFRAPGESLHRELELLVAAGLTPREALIAATRDAAQLLRADSIGVLREGAAADFVVLTADPLRDIRNTRRIELIVARGQEYRPRRAD